jgi:hypothetical protein
MYITRFGGRDALGLVQYSNKKALNGVDMMASKDQMRLSIRTQGKPTNLQIQKLQGLMITALDHTRSILTKLTESHSERITM